MSDEVDGTKYRVPSLTAPADDVYPVSPSNSADLPNGVARALYIGTGGNVRLTGAGGTTATFFNLADGSILPVRVARVLATDTTASNIVALR